MLQTAIRITNRNDMSSLYKLLSSKPSTTFLIYYSERVKYRKCQSVLAADLNLLSKSVNNSLSYPVTEEHVHIAIQHLMLPQYFSDNQKYCEYVTFTILAVRLQSTFLSDIIHVCCLLTDDCQSVRLYKYQT